MNWYEEKIKEELQKCRFDISDLNRPDKYDDLTAEKAFEILLEWACYPQNDHIILYGRSKIAEIPHKWAEDHILNAVKTGFDYSDYWNYHRLLELVSWQFPDKKEEILSLNANSTDPDIAEIIRDFR